MRVRLSLVLLCALLATACTSLIGTPEPVTLTFLVHDYLDQGQYTQWATEFQEEHPHITVEIKNAQNYDERALTGVDVMLTDQMSARQFAAHGMVMDLSSMFADVEATELADFYPGLVDTFKYQGKPYGLPISVDMLVMYYNRDLFDANLADYPTLDWTWDDFLQAGLAISDPDQEIFGYPVAYQNELALLEPIILIQHFGGQVFDNWRAPESLTLDLDANIEAMEFYASLIHDHNISPTWEQGPRLRPSSYPWSRILQGMYGMWMGSLRDRGGQNWTEAWEFNWGVAPLPHGQAPFNLATVYGLMIRADCGHPDEAWLWMQFLSTKFPWHTMPARRSLAEDTAVDVAFGSELAAAARMTLNETTFLTPDASGIETLLETMAEPFDAIRKGTMDPAEALISAQRKLDE